jgi:ribosomal protein S14
MAKKLKNVFKKKLVLAPKVSLNRKWTVWRQSEMKNRQANAQHELKKLALQSLWKDHKVTPNKYFNNDYKMRIQFRIWELDKRASTSKLKNYCHYIGRSRSVNRKLFMARHMFRKFARFGMLPGFVKERC